LEYVSPGPPTDFVRAQNPGVSGSGGPREGPCRGPQGGEERLFFCTPLAREKFPIGPLWGFFRKVFFCSPGFSFSPGPTGCFFPSGVPPRVRKGFSLFSRKGFPLGPTFPNCGPFPPPGVLGPCSRGFPPSFPSGFLFPDISVFGRIFFVFAGQKSPGSSLKTVPHFQVKKDIAEFVFYPFPVSAVTASRNSSISSCIFLNTQCYPASRIRILPPFSA